MRRIAFIAVVGGLGLAGCGGSARSTSTAAHAVVSTTPAAVAGVAARPVRARRAPRVSDPCPSRSSLAPAQTERMPSAATPCFRAIVRRLWRAVQTGSTRGAVYAFFPLRAYEQVKAIADPREDYVGRLVGEYVLDVHAAHALLGPDARAARLVRAIVPQGHVHWVAPGACANRLGYYEVPNARVVYRVAGRVRSFGIASLIAWRGVWYVVHLGAVARSGSSGVVDDPSDGPGESASSLTC